MTRLSRDEQRAVTRERILDAAEQEFLEHGFEGASIDDITARAGYSRGAFYSNFGDKTELLVQLTRRRVETFVEQELPEALTQPTGERVRTVARWLAAQEPPVEALLAVELARLRDRDAEVAATLDRVLDAIIGSVDRMLGLEGSGLEQLADQQRRERVLAIVAGVTGANLLRQLGVEVPAATIELLLSGVFHADAGAVS
ncbi:MAG: TetR/AcrR family transcriptional regulator [Nitriliruptoraceae bacterium]